MGTLWLIGKSWPQRPCMTNWVMYRADPQMFEGNLCQSSHRLYSCRGWGLLTVLVKTQGQIGPSSVSFALLFIGHCCEKYRLPWSQSLMSNPSPTLCRKTLREALCSEQWAHSPVSWQKQALFLPLHWCACWYGHNMSPLFSFDFWFGSFNWDVQHNEMFSFGYVLHDMKWSVQTTSLLHYK